MRYLKVSYEYTSPSYFYRPHTAQLEKSASHDPRSFSSPVLVYALPSSTRASRARLGSREGRDKKMRHGKLLPLSGRTACRAREWSPWVRVVPPWTMTFRFAPRRDARAGGVREGKREREDARETVCVHKRKIAKRARTPARDHVCESSPPRLLRGYSHPRALLPVNGVANTRCAAAASPPPPFRSPSGRSYAADRAPRSSPLRRDPSSGDARTRSPSCSSFSPYSSMKPPQESRLRHYPGDTSEPHVSNGLEVLPRGSSAGCISSILH